ncbi:MAG: tRNA 2-thiouridine(34) synthase MnmA [Magnetovibrionaceae bacterium]
METCVVSSSVVPQEGPLPEPPDLSPEALGLEGTPAENRIVVAMSGGVDSSVVAGLLAEAGYDVVGITLQLYDHGEAIGNTKSCCAGRDIHDARTVADRLGIPHYVLNYESAFRESVMDDFADTYLAGETPIPCVRCNQQVKFRDLLGTARDLGAVAMATGHYVQRDLNSHLLRAVDHRRDQSYFLFATTQEQVDFLRFPLGGLPKDDTRAHARRLGLAISEKPDSQDICFVPDGSYVSVVEKLRPGALDAGEIVDLDGRVLGRHEGIINYTVGQRRGIGIGGTEEPLYVVRLEPDSRRVVVGPKQALAQSSLRVREVNWLGDLVTPGEEAPVLARIRSTTQPVPATVRLEAGGFATVTFQEPQMGVSPGQACVFYGQGGDNARVFGGGWIER